MMALDKAIKSGKEHRKDLQTQKRCRNHGDCAYCKKNRLYNIAKRDKITKKEMKENVDS
jgi:hypothetical protein